MLDIEDAETDPHYLPPLTPTPRSLVLSQPQSARSGRTTSRSTVAPKTFDTNNIPRRTLKQVSRGHREWASGLCDCCEDQRLCWYTCACMPIVIWTLGERLGESYPCPAAWLPGTGASFRTKIRTVGGIKGSTLSDCCVIMCCSWCAVCQMTREVDHMIVQPERFVKPIL
ncbi:cornifelin homolog [Mercenaria mercenaria]|uniref:cornifelin homolog n=1 Tax=Mercenaria mercenaria TaxID=6596 RepID=UPI001E1DC77A|nr:cornifelin homolog [Mercenaria mercenaria]